MHSYRPWMLIIILALFTALAVFPTVQAGLEISPGALTREPEGLQGTSLFMVDPPACPDSGCAAGQRLKMKYEFSLSNYLPNTPEDTVPNVKICIYMPTVWLPPEFKPNDKSIVIDTTGEIPGVVYRTSLCNEADGSPLTDYTMVAARQASITTNQTIDSLGIAFTIFQTAKDSRRIKARVLVRNADGWSILETANSAVIPVIETANPSYVASNGGACGNNAPCYINSGSDSVGGLGTGLKDAINAVPEKGVIYILGTYTIKRNTVNVDRPVVLSSMASAPGTITYSGSTAGANCDGAMLSLSSNITLRGLTINDGNCATKNRTLLEINNAPSGNPLSVRIESNTLTGGDNAIDIHDLAGSLKVFYNHINGNGGRPLFWDGSTKGGTLDVIANNLHGNGGFIECASDQTEPLDNRKADHNYFGSARPEPGQGHCTLNPSKRLGAPIALRTNLPGVNAYLATVKAEKPDAAHNPFHEQLSFLRSGTNSQDFNLYIVDHGFAIEQGVPFTRSYGRSPGPCGNYYDFFLPEGVAPQNTTLELFFRYDNTIDCTAAINSSNICLKQTPTPARVPLFWYDVRAAPAPTAWASSLQSIGSDSGQVTTCDTARKEIKVEIDASGRPNLLEDFNYTPLVAGVPIISTFLPLAYDESVKVNWGTYLEPDVKEFYLLRGENVSSMSVVAGPFDSLGSAVNGSVYSNWDYDMENGKTYYYRLKVVREDGNSIYSEVFPIVPNTPTTVPTATRTLTPTRTPIQPTRTPTLTLVPTQVPTRIPTNTLAIPNANRTRTPTQTPIVLVLPTITGTLWTATPIPFLTVTPDILPTITLTSIPSATFGPEGSPTPTLTPTLPPSQGTGTAIAMMRSLTPAATRRPTRTATVPLTQVGGLEQERPTWLSLLLGLLAGTAISAALAGVWWYLRNRE